MRVTPGERRFTKGEPLNAIELLSIKIHRHAAICSNHVPERHIRMPCSDSHRFGSSQHQWPIERIDELESQFLSQFANRRGPRMFAWLDVASRWQPKPSVLVINQQHMLAIYHDKVRHKVLRRNRRSLHAAQFRARVDPCEHICNVHSLKVIERLDRRNLFSYRAAHVCWFYRN